MSVKFVIEGDIKSAIAALDTFNKRLDAVAKNSAIRSLQTTFSNMANQIGRVNGQLSIMARFVQQMRSGGTGMANALNGVVRNYNKVNASSNIYIKNINHAARQTQALATQTSRLQTAMNGVALTAAKVGLAISKGLSKAAVGFRGSVGSGLGGIQSLGIGVRMSGIALGNQLSQIMSGTLSGNFLSPVLNALKGTINTSVGLVNIGAQMATRIVTGITGTLVKMAGPVVGGAVNAFVGSLGMGIALSAKGVTKVLGATLAGLGDFIQNMASGATQFAGEIVIQLGNVFTGLTEVFRGAFQAAVNVAAGVLNGLVNIAGAVAEKVAGVLGKVATGVVGGAAALGGLSLKDRVESESAIVGATVLFNPNVTPQEKRAFRDKVLALRSEFPTLEGEGIGKAAEMLVSTGFQADPKVASDFLKGLLPLAEVSNLQNLPELARTAAKVYNLFKEEITAAAQADGVGVGDFLAGRLFQVRNVGDLEISDLATHLGEAAGVGKAFGLTLDETLKELAQLSLGLAPDETFTAFRSIITRLQDPAKETRELFADLGVSLKEPSAALDAQLETFDKQREAINSQIASLEKIKGKHKEIAGLKKQLKGIDESESRALRHAKSRNPLEIVRQLLAMDLSEEELAVAFPNVRGLKGIAVQKALSAESKAQIETTFGQKPSEALAGPTSERRDSLAFKFSDIFRKLKDPFDAFFSAAEPTFKKFLDDTASTLGRFGEFVRSALADSGAEEFAANLGDKLAPLFGPFVQGFEALVAMEPGDFWAAMTAGVNNTAAAIEKVIGFGSTVFDIISDIVDATPGIQKAWEAVTGFFGDLGEGLDRTSKGDKSPILNLFRDIEEGLSSLIDKAKALLAGFLVDIAGMIEQLKATVESVWSDVKGGAMTGLGALGGLFAGQAMVSGARFAGGPGATAGAGGAAGGAAGLMAGGSKLGRFAKGFGLFAAPFVAMDLGQQIASGSSPDSFGGSAMNVLGGAGSGAAIGSAIAPGLGTIIGAVVGALAGLLPDVLGGSGEPEGPSSGATYLAEEIGALKLALQTGSVYDRMSRTMRPATGSASEQALAMAEQQKDLLGLQGGDNFVGRLAQDMLKQQIEELKKSVAAEKSLAMSMDAWANGGKEGFASLLSGTRSGIAGIEDPKARSDFNKKLDVIEANFKEAKTFDDFAPFRAELERLNEAALRSNQREEQAYAQRQEQIRILTAVEGALTKESAARDIFPARPGDLTGKAKSVFAGLPSGEEGWMMEAQKRYEELLKGSGIGEGKAGAENFLKDRDLKVRNGKLTRAGSIDDQLQGYLDGDLGGLLKSPEIKDADFSRSDAARAEEDRHRKAKLAKAMGLSLGKDGSLIGKDKPKSLIQRDEFGREFVTGKDGKRQFLPQVTMTQAGMMGARSGSMGAPLGTQGLGGFGMSSGREMARRGISGFGSFGPGGSPNSAEDAMRKRSRLLMEGGKQAAASGNVGAAAEAAKIGADIVKAEGDSGKLDKAFIDALKSLLDEILKNSQAKDQAVAEHEEHTTSVIEDFAKSVKDLKKELDALKERESAAAESTR